MDIYCLECRRTFVKNGFQNAKQRYRCLGCGYTFTEGNLLKGRPRKYKNNAEKQAIYRLQLANKNVLHSPK